MSSNLGKNSPQTLCWDCENSTKPHICPWARDATPVKGWVAKPTRLGGSYPMDSYRVIDCPLFKRDSFDGGVTRNAFVTHDPVRIDLEDVKTLACAIIERYTEDWKALDYGDLKDLVIGGAHIYRHDVLRFFASQWFGDLLAVALPNIEPPQVWAALKINKRMLREVMKVG